MLLSPGGMHESLVIGAADRRGEKLKTLIEPACGLADRAPSSQPDTVQLSAAEQARRLELKKAVSEYAAHCAKFRSADTSRAFSQIITTTIPFVIIVTAMIALANTAYWATLLLAIPASGLLVRFFIIQHDCGHGSFTPTRAMNDTIGRIMSIFTLTPYALWRREHAIHHAGCGNLERRGVGDIETWTVDEYISKSRFARLRYRVYRNPLFLFGFGVPLYFLVIQRLPWFHGVSAKESWKSVVGLNIAMAVFYGGLSYLIGPLTLLKIALPIVVLASAAGGWLFFIQHQFEDTLWDRKEDWDFQVAAVHGSSYYVLPKVLQWFTGNIGLHHIHHLNSMIPNYRLQECMDALPALATINRLTLMESLSCVRLTLWDPVRRRLIGFGELPQAA